MVLGLLVVKISGLDRTSGQESKDTSRWTD
jgi:hypothetical protein